MRKGALLIFVVMLLDVSFNLAQDLKTFSISTLTHSDTLTLFTIYSDCGEFGGHHEIVKIFREKELQFLYTKDTVTCEADNPNEFRKIILSKKELLNNGSAKLIEKYVHADYAKSKQENYGCSNAFRVFWIECRGQHLQFSDSCTEWDEFAPMVAQLLK